MALRRTAVAASLAATLAALGGCSTASPGGPDQGTGSGRVIRVVAAENFWGSLAAQLGGDHVRVTNIVDSPAADPHDYEPTTADGRAVATADLVLVNGVGYDPWASRLVEADADPAMTVIDVGRLAGVPGDGNPHRWYDPSDVQLVIARITADYRRIDPAHAADYDRLNAELESTGLAAYKAVIADIRTRFAGTPVGASESIFALMSPALGLDLVTPAGFLRAVSQGTEPTAADKATIDAQIAGRAIEVYVFNRQNATPDVQAQVDAAKAAGIPVATITETLTPSGATFQAWQTAQLTVLRDALAKATGR